MKRCVVSVRDHKMASFGQPWFVPTLGVAERAFTDDINNPESIAFKHPEDYELFHLGWFEEESGRFENLDVPTQLCTGVNVKRKENKS